MIKLHILELAHLGASSSYLVKKHCKDNLEFMQCILFNPHKNGLFVALMQNGLKYGVSLQFLLSS